MCRYVSADDDGIWSSEILSTHNLVSAYRWHWLTTFTAVGKKKKKKAEHFKIEIVKVEIEDFHSDANSKKTNKLSTWH